MIPLINVEHDHSCTTIWHPNPLKDSLTTTGPKCPVSPASARPPCALACGSSYVLCPSIFPEMPTKIRRCYHVSMRLTFYCRLCTVRRRMVREPPSPPPPRPDVRSRRRPPQDETKLTCLQNHRSGNAWLEAPLGPLKRTEARYLWPRKWCRLCTRDNE